MKIDPRTFRKKLVEEIESIGVNVTRQTVTNALRREGLRWRRTRKTHLPKKKHLLCAHKQFAT